MLFRDILMAAATQGGGKIAFDGQYVNGGDFASATPWTLSTPASSNISGGKLNFTSAVGVRRCYQPSLGTYVLSNVYRATGTASNYVDGSITIRLGTDATGSTLTGTAVVIIAGDLEWPVADGPFSVDIELNTLTGQNHMIGGTTGSEFSIDDFSIIQL